MSIHVCTVSIYVFINKREREGEGGGKRQWT